MFHVILLLRLLAPVTMVCRLSLLLCCAAGHLSVVGPCAHVQTGPSVQLPVAIFNIRLCIAIDTTIFHNRHYAFFAEFATAVAT